MSRPDFLGFSFVLRSPDSARHPMHRARFALPVCALLATAFVPFLWQQRAAERLTAERLMASAAMQGAAEPAPVAYKSRKLCDLSDERINESSGLAASRRHPGFLWTHNDSGDGPRLFLVGTAGQKRGQTAAIVTLQGAPARDWEDMAVAGTGRSAWVYAGDIGDNGQVRSDITVFRFREPALPLKDNAPDLVLPYERLTLRYPDGAHDAETLLATPDGHLLIVTKNADVSLVFMTPRPFVADATQTLERIGQVRLEGEGWPGRLITGGDLSPDRTRLVLRTYTAAHEWRLNTPPGASATPTKAAAMKSAATKTGATTRPAGHPSVGTKPAGSKQAGHKQPAPVASVPDEARRAAWRRVWSVAPRSQTLPPLRQGEAICYSADGRHWFVSSEQLPTPIYEVEPDGAPQP